MREGRGGGGGGVYIPALTPKKSESTQPAPAHRHPPIADMGAGAGAGAAGSANGTVSLASTSPGSTLRGAGRTASMDLLRIDPTRGSLEPEGTAGMEDWDSEGRIKR